MYLAQRLVRAGSTVKVHNNLKGVKQKISIKEIRAFYNGFLNPFWKSISIVQRVVFLLSVVALPSFLFAGHLFDVFSSISSIIKGLPVNFPNFVVAITESALIFYSIALLLQFQTEKAEKVINLPVYTMTNHHCLEIRTIPYHLLDNDDQDEVPDFEFPPFFNLYRDVLDKAGVTIHHNPDGSFTREAIEVIIQRQNEIEIDDDQDGDSINLLDQIRALVSIKNASKESLLDHIQLDNETD